MSAIASTITIDCPSEVLLELHVSEEELADLMTVTAAMELFRTGRGGEKRHRQIPPYRRSFRPARSTLSGMNLLSPMSFMPR